MGERAKFTFGGCEKGVPTQAGPAWTHGPAGLERDFVRLELLEGVTGVDDQLRLLEHGGVVERDVVSNAYGSSVWADSERTVTSASCSDNPVNA